MKEKLNLDISKSTIMNNHPHFNNNLNDGKDGYTQAQALSAMRCTYTSK
jgi:hypothetical protein